MRVNFSFMATVFVALLVLGTVGCRSNGGPWYKPDSYVFANPFSKDDIGRESMAPPFGGSATADARPSLDSQPNIGVPPGGYTDGSALAGRSAGGGTPPPETWGQPNPMVPQGPSNFGGYSVPEPSQYSLSETYAPHSGTYMSHQQAAPQGNPYIYPESVHQASNTISQTSHQPTALQQPINVPMGGAWDQPGQHAPFGGNMPPHQDPFAVPPPQQGTFPPSGFYEQPPVHQMEMAPVPHQMGGHQMGGVGADAGMMVSPQQQPPQQQPFGWQ